MIEIIEDLKALIALNEKFGTMFAKATHETEIETEDYADLKVAVASTSMAFAAIEAIANRHNIMIHDRQFFQKVEDLDRPTVVTTPTCDQVKEQCAHELNKAAITADPENEN